MDAIVVLCEEIARKAHKGQTRYDGKTPYIEHIKKVVSLVGEDEELQCLAWLHDVIEDSEHTMNTLTKLGVPKRIVWFVDNALTHKKEHTYFEYIKNIKTIEIATRVKIADVVANLSDSPTSKQAVKYYKALCILCGEGGEE